MTGTGTPPACCGSNLRVQCWVLVASYRRGDCCVLTRSCCLLPAHRADGLYEDLLRRAGGDRQVVSLWLAEMGYEPGQFAEQQQQAGAAVGTIKAVGTRSETRLGKWATAGSLTTAANKTKLALTGAARRV